MHTDLKKLAFFRVIWYNLFEFVKYSIYVNILQAMCAYGDKYDKGVE